VTIAILDYGMGNLCSVERALAHVGADAQVTADPDVALGAAAVLVPGVGHFGACVRGLRRAGLDAVVTEFAASGRPVFGVCVGMQILFNGSEEDGEPGRPRPAHAELPGRRRTAGRRGSGELVRSAPAMRGSVSRNCAPAPG